MAGTWYRSGTVSLTNGSKIVLGSGTEFSKFVSEGFMFLAGGEFCEIDVVDSDLQLTLVEPFGGATASGIAFACVPTQGTIPPLTQRVTALMAAMGGVKDDYEAGNLMSATALAGEDGAEQVGTPEGSVQVALNGRLKTADLDSAVGTTTVVPHVLRVLLCGDSLGAGQGTSNPGTGGTTGWPARMAAYLTTYFGVVAGGAGSTVTVDVRNFSVGGSYSGSSFNRMTQRIQETAPTLVLLMDTPNDTRIDGGNVDLMNTEANFRRMVGLSRMYGQPVIITSAPIDGTMYTTPGVYDGTSETKRRAHCVMLRALAAEMGVLLIDVDAALSSNQDWTHAYAANDGIHAQDVGADMIGKIVARTLAGMPLLKMFGINVAADTFARADSASSMGSTETGSLVWTPLSGTWGISGNKAYMVSGANVRTGVDTGVVDHEAQVDLILGTNAGGVEVRQLDAANALGLVYQGSGTFRLRVVKWVAGVLTTLKSSNAFDALTGAHNLRLSISGSTLTGYLDGAPLLEYSLTSAEQSTFAGATHAGLYSQTPGVAAASFRNFVVRSLALE